MSKPYKYSDEPCVKCSKPTTHKTGICADCRTEVCKCGAKYVRKNFKLRGCPDCLKNLYGKSRGTIDDDSIYS